MRVMELPIIDFVAETKIRRTLPQTPPIPLMPCTHLFIRASRYHLNMIGRHPRPAPIPQSLLHASPPAMSFAQSASMKAVIFSSSTVPPFSSSHFRNSLSDRAASIRGLLPRSTLTPLGVFPMWPVDA